MRTPNKNLYQSPVPKKFRLRGNSFLTFFTGVGVIVGILALTAVGFMDVFDRESPIPKKALQPQANPSNTPVNIPNVNSPNLALESNSTVQDNSYLQSILGNKGQIQLVSLLRDFGKTDEVKLQMRVYRNAAEVTPTDIINVGSISAKNSISGETYQPIDPVKQSSGIIKLSDIPVGKYVDAYVVLRVPKNAIVLDIISDNATKFKNTLIGIAEPVVTGLNNNSSLPPISGISGLPKAPIPGNTAYPLPSAMQKANLPEVAVPGNSTNQDISNALAIAFGKTPVSTSVTTSQQPKNQTQTTPVPIPSGANLINQETQTAPAKPNLPPPPTVINSKTNSPETTPQANIPLADKAAPTLQEHDIVLENNGGFKPGEFTQLAYGSKARVELISVQRVPDPKSGDPDIVSVQMRISRLDEKVAETNIIKLSDTTASNSVSAQSYKPVNSLENVSLPVALKDIPQNSSIDTYVWLKVPKGVYAIDIFVPETGAFKNVPIAH
ncbi:hypothetical protein IQ264_20230 [Phormidium sp. LEGE 05292]|uniref:hypothetical protein n=1 Tax=[Phormidium] sp. LEGE 05292 TaxID=767427 RepID=UPI0018803041|nr:hypothetical protein [Phormidium sp. LEGE 05292]MBE9227756.1 hypothetical protein [Phormidium sp. LEGE 05292]